MKWRGECRELRILVRVHCECAGELARFATSQQGEERQLCCCNKRKIILNSVISRGGQAGGQAVCLANVAYD